MANKPFNTRIQLKHDTEANWIKAVNFKPLMSELIIYDVDATHSSPRFKVGDGTTNVNDLPFVTAEYVETDPTVPAWAKAATKPTYTAAEVGALPDSTVIPTKTSQLTNDSNFLTAHQDISGKADKNATVSTVSYNTTSKKITKTINGTTTDVVSAATLKSDMSFGAAADKGVTDNSTATAVTSTDTNLITARTLYNAGYTKNTGTVTGITMNGSSKGTSGVVDLGTVITAHQDISGKADKSATVSNVVYDTTNKKITKTINGTTSDVVSAATLKTDMSLGNVENKSSATIRSELTSKNVTDALGFTPTTNTGTVTSVATGTGLTGGTITGSGTIKAKLKSEEALSNDSVAATETSDRIYPVAVDKSGYLAVNVPWTDSKPVTSVAGKTGAVTLAKGDVGLGNVDNKSSATIRSEITSSNVTTALGFTPLNASLKGANSGVAELDSNGKVPSSQLPSYVDDVLEYIAKTGFPSTGETGKIYVDTTTNKTYRWSGSDYVEISASLALGTTSSTAFRGDYGNAAYAHAVTNKGSAFSSGLYKITTNSEGHVTAATAVAKADITALGIPASDTTYSNKTAISGGTDVSLVTTGEKYTWNSKTTTAVKGDKESSYRTGNVNLTAANIGALPISGGTLTGNLSINYPGIDATKANNNVTSTLYPTTLNLCDSNGKIMSRMEGVVRTTGEIEAYWYMRNYDTSGNQVGQKGIRMSMNKSGALTYTISDPTNFVSALGLKSSVYIAAPLFITTSNSSASDALTYGTATTLSTGQLVFVTLNAAMVGSANATLQFGSNTAINIYLTGTTQLKAKYAAGTMLGLVYNGTNLYMINPPVAV